MWIGLCTCMFVDVDVDVDVDVGQVSFLQWNICLKFFPCISVNLQPCMYICNGKCIHVCVYIILCSLEYASFTDLYLPY
jgi:hypothetical protein